MVVADSKSPSRGFVKSRSQGYSHGPGWFATPARRYRLAVSDK